MSQKLNLRNNSFFNQLRIRDANSACSNDRLIEKSTINVLMFGPALSEQGGMGSVQRLSIEHAPKELNIKHITTWNGKSNTFVLFYKASVIFLLRLFQHRVDIVHIHVSERGSVVRKLILALIAFAWSKPVIMHTHGCEFHLFFDSLPKFARQLISKIWQGCDRTLVLSKSWQQIYIDKLQLPPHKVLVRYNPVDVPKHIAAHTSSDRIKFILLGKVARRKGVFDLLEAVSQLSLDYQDKIGLTIAGNGKVEEAIALAKELQIESLVNFIGWVDRQQCDRLLEEADVFVLPSYNEGLPMALLEAMSFRLPVITTPVGGIPEIIIDRENGLSILPGKIEELVNAIQTLVDNESLRLKLGSAAYERAKLLDIENYIRDLFEIYYSVLEDSSKLKLSPQNDSNLN